MQFQPGFYLDYSIVDLSSDDGKTVDPNGRFYVYNPDTIHPEYSHHIVLIQGYNTDFFQALNAGIDYFDVLKPQIQGKANFILIYWPGYVGKIHFSQAVQHTGASAPNFSAAISYILSHSGAESPHFTFIAHSLGNGECAQSILYLKNHYNLAPVKKFIQLAPAINANAYLKDFQQVPVLAPKVTTYYSQSDMVLKNDYTLWNEAQLALSLVGTNIKNFFVKNKVVNPYYAMGYLGLYGNCPQSVQTIDANSITDVAVDHGTYLTDKKLINDVAKWVNRP